MKYRRININLKITNLFFFLLVFIIPFNIEKILFDQNKIGGLPSGFSINLTIIISLILFIVTFQKNKNEIKLPFIHIWVMMISVILYLPILFRNDGLYNQLYALSILLPFILLYLFFNNSRVDDLWITFKRAFFTTMLIQSMIGCYQWVNKEPLGLFFLGENENPFRKGVSENFMGVSGTLGHPSTFAFLMGIATLLSLVKATTIGGKKIDFIMFIYFYSFVFLSQARTSIFVVLLLSVLIYFFTNKHKIKALLKISIVLTFSVYFISKFTNVFDRFLNSDFIRQIGDRGNLNDIAFNIIYSNNSIVFWGLGQNNYSIFAQKIYSTGFASTHPVHNIYLLSAIENGILLTTIILFSIFTIYIHELKKVLDSNYNSKEMSISIVVVLTYALIYGFTDWALVQPAIALTMQLLLLFGISTQRVIQN